MPPLGVMGLVSHIRHKYFSPWNICLGNLAYFIFQHRRRLQYVFYFNILNKYFIAQIAVNTCIFHWKKVKTGMSDYPFRVKLNLKLATLFFFLSPHYLFQCRNESCWEEHCLIFILRHTIVAGYYGFTVVRESVCPSIVHPSARFSFPDDNLSKHQWIFTKLGICIDIMEIWFRIANGQISSIFDRVICPRHAHIFVSGL